MSISELKKACHLMVDQVEDRRLLEEFLEALKNHNDNKDSDFWNELTETQKRELEEAWIESEDERNLVSHEDVMKMSGQWLKK